MGFLKKLFGAGTSPVDESKRSVFKIIQDKQIIEKARSQILLTGITGGETNEETSLNGIKVRFRSTAGATYVVDILQDFHLNLPNVFSGSIRFYKPLGFYHFDNKPGTIAFTIANEHESIAKEQDRFGIAKNINIYYGNNKFGKAIWGGFSAENRFVLDTFFMLEDSGKLDAIAEYDSLMLLQTVSYKLQIAAIRLKYTVLRTDSMQIQIALDEEGKDFPIMFSSRRGELSPLPDLQNRYDKLSEFGVLSFNEKITRINS
jgi:hypothetical protein